MKGHTSDPDDWSDGRLDEQKSMSENQIALYKRICQFKPMEVKNMETIKSLVEGMDPLNLNPVEMEVPLQMMTALAITLATDQKINEV